VPSSELATRPATVATFDLGTARVADLDVVETEFLLESLRAGPVDRVVGWFSCEFGSGAEASDASE
jgi:hypothetical protein